MSVSALRWTVLFRDSRCIARMIDPQAGPCFDRWGDPLGGGLERLEMDYVKRGAKYPHHVHESDHVALCPGHHQGAGPNQGKVWARAHRKELRAYLERLYPSR